jgi:hypothetical protein
VYRTAYDCAIFFAQARRRSFSVIHVRGKIENTLASSQAGTTTLVSVPPSISRAGWLA